MANTGSSRVTVSKACLLKIRLETPAHAVGG